MGLTAPVYDRGMPFPPELLTDDEDLVLDLRPHWWYLAPSGAVLAVVVVFGLAATIGDWPQLIKMFAGLLVLGSLIWFAVKYARWATTNFVVTSERVISRAGLVAKQGIEIPLDRINTVFYSQTVFERMVGQGDLGVESAGEGGRQDFKNIRKPNLVQNEIYRQKEALEQRKLHRMGTAVASASAPADSPDIPEQIARLDQLRRDGLLSDAEFEAKKQELLGRM